MPRSERAPSRFGAGDGTGDRAEGLTEPLLDADDVSTPAARFSARRAAGGGTVAPERTPPDTTARRAGLGIPPSPTPEEWSALRRDLHVRHGELYVTSPAGARPTTSSGVPLLRDASLFRAIAHAGRRRFSELGATASSADSLACDVEKSSDDSEDDGLETDDATRSTRHRVSLAAEYVRDALDGSTHLTFRCESRFARSVARAQRTKTYAFVLSTCLFLNLCLVFVEPNTRRSPFAKTQRTRVLLLELAFTSAFVFTAWLDLARLGTERFRAKRWRSVFAAGSAALFVDALVALFAATRLIRDDAGVSSAFGRAHSWLLARPTRCLRPLLVIAHFRPTRRLVASAAKTLPRLRSTVRLIGALILAWSTLGVQLYQGAYDVADVDDRGNFDNAFDGAVAMTVLLTTENFPDVMRPSLGTTATTTNGVPKPVSAVFFVSFIVLGVWLGMSLWTSVIFETYKQQHRHKARGARAHEQKALIAAYSVLQDSPADEPLPAETWIAVAKRARPGLSDAHARALFATLDEDGDGKIDVDAFLRTCDALRSRVARAPSRVDGALPGEALPERDVERDGVSDERRGVERRGVGSAALVAPRTDATRARVGSLVRSRAFARASTALVFFQATVICARRRDAGAGADAVVDALDGACVAALALETAIRLVAATARRDGAPRRTRDGTIAAASIFSGAGGAELVRERGFDAAVALVSVASFAAPFAQPRLRRAVAPLRVLRLASTDPRQTRIVSTFARCARVIGTLLVVLSCVVYAYACVGLELFSSEVTRRRGYCASGDETAADEARTSDFSANETSAANAAALCLDKVENFEAPWNAFLALFQVVTSNNWHDILYPNAAAMRDGGAGEFGRVFAVFYFVSFYFVTVLLLVNILTSLVLEMFGVTRFERGGAEEGARSEGGGDGGDGETRDATAAASSSPFVIREVVIVDGVAFEATRPRDFDRDVLLADGGGAAAERAALVKQLEQAERQIARRRHERVSGIVRAMRARRNGDGDAGVLTPDGDGAPAVGAAASPTSSFRFRFRAAEPDLARELDALDDDDRARVIEILRAEAR